MHTEWIAISTIGALGLGAIAASAASVANAVELRSADGSVVQGTSLSGDITSRDAVRIKTTGDHASVISANTAQSAASPVSAQSPASVPSANSAPSAGSND